MVVKLLKLISMFDVDASFEGDKLAALELLSSEEVNYGLSHLPKHVYIHASLLNAKLNTMNELEAMQNSVIGRASTSRYRNMKSWFQDYASLLNSKPIADGCQYWETSSLGKVLGGYPQVGFDCTTPGGCCPGTPPS